MARKSTAENIAISLIWAVALSRSVPRHSEHLGLGNVKTESSSRTITTDYDLIPSLASFTNIHPS